MIIDKRTWSQMSDKDIKDLIKQHNKKYGVKFWSDGNYFHVGKTAAIPLSMLNYHMLRYCFMTDEEFIAEAGKTDAQGRMYF